MSVEELFLIWVGRVFHSLRAQTENDVSVKSEDQVRAWTTNSFCDDLGSRTGAACILSKWLKS